jgi:glycerol-3-phosphate acyltransferase PlsY
MLILPLLILAYLLGAFPTAVVLGKVSRGTDVRDHGSGNAGGTNAWRVFGWKIGLPVMLFDVIKGVLASMAIPRIPIGPLPLELSVVALLCGVAAVLGHVFPVYTRFRGGKGVATGAGILVVLAPIPAAIAVGVFALVLVTFGRVSLSSILAAVSLPLSVYLMDPRFSLNESVMLFVLTCTLALFIIYTHRSNIRRLLHGEERAFTTVQLWRRVLRRRP